jgi:hypothetical protein
MCWALPGDHGSIFQFRGHLEQQRPFPLQESGARSRFVRAALCTLDLPICIDAATETESRNFWGWHLPNQSELKPINALQSEQGEFLVNRPQSATLANTQGVLAHVELGKHLVSTGTKQLPEPVWGECRGNRDNGGYRGRYGAGAGLSKFGPLVSQRGAGCACYGEWLC